MAVELLTKVNRNVLQANSYGTSMGLLLFGANKENVGNPGDKFNKDLFVKATKDAGTTLVFDRHVDEPTLEELNVVIPPTEIEHKYIEDDYLKMQNKNTLGATRMTLSDSIARKLDKWFFQGPVADNEAAMDDLIYGLIDTSNPDGSEPLQAITCDAGSSNLSWGDAGSAQKCILGLKGALKAKGFKGPFVLLYPESSSQLFESEMLTGASVYAGKSIETYAKENYGAVIPIPNDIDGNCVLTGNAETSTDAQIAAIALDGWKIVYTRDVTFSEWYEQGPNAYYMRGIANMSLVPKPRKVGDYYYKGMSELDSITSAASG